MRAYGALLILAALVSLASAEIQTSPSNLYGLEIVELGRPYAAALFTGSRVLLAGEGYLAKADLERKRIEAQLAVLGGARAIAIDSVPGEWAAIGTDRGEVVIVSLSTMTKRTSTFVASRAPVSSVHLVRAGLTSKMIVLDEIGFLYIMGVVRGMFSGGWFEAGPIPHQGALSGLYDVRVQKVYPTVAPLGWTSEVYLGDKVIAFLDAFLPGPRVVNGFLGGATVEVFYRDSMVVPAHVGITRIGNETEIERNLYYAVIGSHMILPLSPSHNGLTSGNQTITLRGLPPGSYRLVAIYEVKTKELRRGILSSTCYAGDLHLAVRPGEVARLPSLVLERRGSQLHECVASIEIDGRPLQRLMRPERVQVLLLIDASGLPGEYEFGRDISTVLVPITGEMLSRGVESITDHSAVILMKPQRALPGLERRSETLLFIAVGGWLFVYYLGPGLTLSNVGYPQPQIIYIGDSITSLEVSPDGRRVYVGTVNGTVFRLLWLRDHPLFPHGELRYYIDSSLHVGGSPISSVRELEGGELLMVTTSAGRIQLVSVSGRSWEPAWRSDREFLGVETGLRDLAVIWRGNKEVILASPGSARLYVFRLPLTGISPVELRLGLIEFSDEGGWRLRALESATTRIFQDDRLAASAEVANGTALIYLPPGRYELMVELSGVRSKRVPIVVGEGYSIIEMAVVVQPDHLVVEPIVDHSLLRSIAELYIPKMDIDIQIRDVDGNPIEAGKRVVLSGSRGTFSAITKHGSVSFKQIPIGLYTLLIQEPGPTYEPLRAQIRVTLRGAEPGLVMLKPKTVPVRLSLRDPVLQLDVREQFVVRIERLEPGSALLDYPREVRFSGSISLGLPLGTYRISPRVVGPSMYQEPRPVQVVVDGEKAITLSLTPREFPIRVEVRDSWNNPVAGARVSFIRTEGAYAMEAVTDKNGVAELSLPHGRYELVVEGRFYRSFSKEIEVRDDVDEKVKLEPTLPLIAWRYAPYMLLLAGAAGAVVAIRKVKRMIEERMKEEYF